MRKIKALILTGKSLSEPKLSRVVYCPRCQRPYTQKSSETHEDLMDRVIKHVSGQHPDHDPQWWDTYPDGA